MSLEFKRFVIAGLGALFLLSLVVGLALALRLVKGITEPVKRLVDGTEDVAAGRWNVQVPVAREDRLANRVSSYEISPLAAIDSTIGCCSTSSTSTPAFSTASRDANWMGRW